LEPELLHRMDAYWRAANYLSVGQLYLYDNPLLTRPLTLSGADRCIRLSAVHWPVQLGQKCAVELADKARSARQTLQQMQAVANPHLIIRPMLPVSTWCG
jgi:phosphoketolase